MRPPSDSDSSNALVPRKPEPSFREQPYPYGYDYPDDPDSGTTLLDYWHILLRHKRALLLIAFLGALLALLVTLPQTPVYQAKTTLEIQSLNTDFMNMKQVTPVDDGGLSLTRETIDTQIEILKSVTLADRTLRKLGWTERRAQLQTDTGRPSSWRRALHLPDQAEQDPRQALLNQVKESLKVRAQGQTRIVEVLVDSTDPKLAAEFANTLTNEFIDMNLEARWEMTQRTSDWLTRQLEDMLVKLERSYDRLQNYAHRVGLVITEKEGSIVEEKLRQVQEELSKAQADRITRESRLELAKISPPETLADILNDSSLREYQTKLTDLHREEAELAATFTAEHPKIKRVEAQIATIEQALKNERDAILQRIRNDYQEALQREKLLDADYLRQARLLSDQSEKSIQYDILKREVDSNQQIYDTILERVRSASVASALRASNVRVVDKAKPPGSPYKPRLMMNTLLGLMLGGFLGVVFVIVRERADRTLQEPGDLSFHLNLPELGVIPAADEKRSLRSQYRHKKDLALTSGDKHAGDVELAVWNRKSSVLAESFRATLTSILFSGGNGARPHVLVLTSANPGEGKSTLASDLAIALAEVDRKVLLIDGDLRKPRQHEIFDLEKDHGLSELLKGHAPLSESLNGSVRQTKVPNLFLLPSGAESAASTNLLYSERMAHLLELFKKEFDTVLIDTPPMLQIPDARILGRMSDAVILVIRAGRTTRDSALAAKQRLTEDGVKILGAVLNHFDPKRTTAGYRYDRYYHYSKYYE